MITWLQQSTAKVVTFGDNYRLMKLICVKSKKTCKKQPFLKESHKKSYLKGFILKLFTKKPIYKKTTSMGLLRVAE